MSCLFVCLYPNKIVNWIWKLELLPEKGVHFLFNVNENEKYTFIVISQEVSILKILTFSQFQDCKV